MIPLVVVVVVVVVVVESSHFRLVSNINMSDAFYSLTYKETSILIRYIVSCHVMSIDVT